MTNKFFNVKTEKGTRITLSTDAKFGDYEVLYQKWAWGGIDAESLIFVTKDIAHISENELTEDVKNSPLVKDKSKSLTYKQGDEFTFVNFNFEVCNHEVSFKKQDYEPREKTLAQEMAFRNFDIFGDIHGHSCALIELLDKLGYKVNDEGFYKHPFRMAIFVGDFIDRGPRQKAVIDIVKPMVENGAALAVMGNHEFNAISYHTLHPATGEPLRSHSDNHKKQHQAFLDEFTNDVELKETIDWFKTLPLFLELSSIRVIHACWNDKAIASIQSKLDSRNRLDDAFLIAANEKGSVEFEAVETLLKGLELRLPAGYSFKDSYGQPRHDIRIKWWQTEDRSYRELAIVPKSNKSDMPIDVAPIDDLGDFQYSDNSKLVFFGHYWFQGQPKRLKRNVACLDYSVAKNGALTAYRWSGSDLEIHDRCFIQVN
ncbi:metallophosphoesterase [Brumicola pallidula]|uniref:Diadenosine tetraphosphatase-like protein n=1 Tax=Brumicola pallidula DSM 14239 = ACAM 615 TaxID=1121922 RepID=K6ZNC8_9ALTE|nr:metallophosphoesterase [Glaciecola pallidula]GAC30388.1 diadenosine tetraphosphatase-like protein [Glaciecola pallidula DSM 14239 = ACAM 615]